MTSNDNGHINNLDENQTDSLKKCWISLLSEIDDDPSKIVASSMGIELFYLFGMDDPDMILLRWLRARKWDVPSAVQSLMDTLKWRSEFGLRKLLEKGEWDLNLDECASGKLYHMGKDKSGRPVTYVHASEHFRGQYPIESTEKSVVFTMELGRYIAELPIEQGTVVLDMANITLKNLDYQHIKFMINVMQNHYPEGLGMAFVVNAPWGFTTIWSMIRPWLDPVVESKIRFLKSSKDLIEYIDPEDIPQRLEGSHDDFKFVPPNKQDEQRLQTFRQENIRAEKASLQYKQVAQLYLDITFKWASSSTKNNQQLHSDRINATKKLNQSYEQLLPYISTETHYHRTQIIKQPIFDTTYNKIINRDHDDDDNEDDDEDHITQF